MVGHRYIVDTIFKRDEHKAFFKYFGFRHLPVSCYRPAPVRRNRRKKLFSVFGRYRQGYIPVRDIKAVTGMCFKLLRDLSELIKVQAVELLINDIFCIISFKLRIGNLIPLIHGNIEKIYAVPAGIGKGQLSVNIKVGPSPYSFAPGQISEHIDISPGK